MNPELFQYVLRLADDHLILGQRMGEWCSQAPTLEEDLAMSNIGLDLLGQARALYTYAGKVEGKGRGEDDLAFLRPELEYRNALLVEQPNGDFAFSMARQFFFAAFMVPFWREMMTSADAELQAVDHLPEEVMDEHFFDVNDWTSTRFVLASELALRKAEPNEAAKLTDKVLGDLTEKRHRIRVLDPAIIAYVSADRAADANDCLDEYIDATRSAGLDAQDRLRHTFLRASVARAPLP